MSEVVAGLLILNIEFHNLKNQNEKYIEPMKTYCFTRNPFFNIPLLKKL